MYYIDFNIANSEYNYLIISFENTIICESFIFKNSKERFTKLQLLLNSLNHSHKIKTDLEAIDIYEKELKILYSVGYNFNELTLFCSMFC